jgi:CPA2 family monovalent cation:H+ antiporter-2
LQSAADRGTAIGLAQVGEFSFILGRAGFDAGLVPESTWQVLLGASILTMMVTPSLLAVGPTVGAWLRSRKSIAPGVAGGAVHPASDHVIVLGFGAFSRTEFITREERRTRPR